MGSSLRTVAERRVHGWPVGGNRWEAPVAGSMLGWIWLSELPRPDRFDWDLPVEIAAAYRPLYDRVPAEDPVTTIIDELVVQLCEKMDEIKCPKQGQGVVKSKRK